jgi:2-dehydro-3-deoxygluconokinase
VEEAQRQSTDVVCVGETMLLLVPDPPSPPEQAEVFRRDIGGAESNVAIHLARRGRSTGWVSALGQDAFGEYVRARVAGEGVDCAAVRTVPGGRTGLYVKELHRTGTSVAYYRDGSAACTLGPGDAEQVWRRRPRIVHTTGITAALSPTSRTLVQQLFQEPRSAVVRSFDINYRPRLHPPDAAEVLRELASHADVVFCGADEAEALWGVRQPNEVAELFGPVECVVVKLGAEGAIAFRGAHTWHEPAPAVQVVEPVGAGDAFAAGVIDGLLDGRDLGICLRRGTTLAAQVLQVDGDLPPRGPQDRTDPTPMAVGPT